MQDEKGKTILFEAIDSGFEDLIRQLLEKGADITVTAILGNTALHQAALVNTKMTALILQHANLVLAGKEKENFINKKNKFGNTALLLAVEKNNPDTVETLLSAGANPNIANNDGFTPLHQAILQEKPSEKTITIVQLLMEYGANPTIEVASQLISGKKRTNKSPLELAKKMMDDIAATEFFANKQQEANRYANLKKIYEEMLARTSGAYDVPAKTTVGKSIRFESPSLNNALKKLMEALQALRNGLGITP